MLGIFVRAMILQKCAAVKFVKLWMSCHFFEWRGASCVG